MRVFYQDVLGVVCSLHHVKLNTLRSERRHRALLRPRFVAAWLLRNLCGLSYPEVGAVLGGKHHTTIMNACRRIDSDLRRGDGHYADWLIETIGEIEFLAEMESAA